VRARFSAGDEDRALKEGKIPIRERSIMIMNSKTRFHFLVAGLVISLLVISSALSAQSGRSWMKGIVLGVSESQGMRGASVELLGDPDIPSLRGVSLNVVTDDTGRYLFKVVPYGNYTFKVSAPGFLPYEIKLYIASDSETQLHVRLRKENK
jgi:hypothetical protein